MRRHVRWSYKLNGWVERHDYLIGPSSARVWRVWLALHSSSTNTETVMKGAYFKGWGFMRFWNTTDKSRTGGNHNFVDSADGEGNGPEFGAVINPATWRWPHCAMLAEFDSLH